MSDEWHAQKGSKCHLHRSLAEFLKLHFADVKLADQVGKHVAIERLERSANFATTHNSIERLSAIDDYTPQELSRLISAYKSNDQIHWILGDDDVQEFAHKLVTMAYDNQLIDEVFPVEEMLNELELRNMP